MHCELRLSLTNKINNEKSKEPKVPTKFWGRGEILTHEAGTWEGLKDYGFFVNNIVIVTNVNSTLLNFHHAWNSNHRFLGYKSIIPTTAALLEWYL